MSYYDPDEPGYRPPITLTPERFKLFWMQDQEEMEREDPLPAFPSLAAYLDGFRSARNKEEDERLIMEPGHYNPPDNEINLDLSGQNLSWLHWRANTHLAGVIAHDSLWHHTNVNWPAAGTLADQVRPRYYKDGTRHYECIWTELDVSRHAPANTPEITFSDCKFYNVNFARSCFNHCTIANCEFHYCSFQGVRAFGATWRECIFPGCDFLATDFAGSHFDGCKMPEDSIHQANFKNCIITRAHGVFIAIKAQKT